MLLRPSEYWSLKRENKQDQGRKWSAWIFLKLKFSFKPQTPIRFRFLDKDISEVFGQKSFKLFGFKKLLNKKKEWIRKILGQI